MARPLKRGIDYYPLDVNFLTDIKTRKIMRACGNESIGILISILSNIYRDNGYFIEVDYDFNFLVADETNVQENEVETVILKAVEVGFFDTNLYHTYKILTSQGIQSRYIKACEKRKRVDIEKGYSLLVDADVKGNINLVNDLINSQEVVVNAPDNSIDDGRSTQSKVKERIVKDSKVNNSIKDTAEIEKDFNFLWDLYPNKKGKQEAFKAYKREIKNGVTNQQIESGILSYKREIENKRTQPNFIAHGSTWFNNKRWEDSYDVGGDPNDMSWLDTDNLFDGFGG